MQINMAWCGEQVWLFAVDMPLTISKERFAAIRSGVARRRTTKFPTEIERIDWNAQPSFATAMSS
jgi:hypothetical protein